MTIRRKRGNLFPSMNTEHALFLQAFQAIQRAHRILLISDGRPDGDSIGSSSAFLNWLKREGKEVRAFCKETLPSALQFLDGAHEFSNDPTLFDQSYDLIITFDASDLRHCGIDALLPKLPAGYAFIMFDHHNTNVGFGQINILLKDACSTCEVVSRFFDAMNVVVDDRMATSLLAGIFTDTSNFSNGGTTIKGMEAASRLVQSGARQSDIIRHLIKNKSIDGLKLWGLALSRLQHHKDLDLVSTYFLQDDLKTPADEEAVDGMSNFLNAMCGGCDTVLVLKETSGNKIKGSLRSVTRDISRVAKLLGGGGHKKASGFMINGRIQAENGRMKIVN